MEFIQEFTVRTHEVDKNKDIKVPSLLMLMQEASMRQVVDLRASVWDMESMKISWVLLRKDLRIDVFPRLGEKIKIITYPAGFDRVFAYRDYKVYNQSGEIIATAGSTWTLINTETRKLERIPQQFYHLKPPENHELLERPANKVKDLTDPSITATYKVGYFDLDWNGHVNNIVLSKLLLQTVPESFLDNCKLQKFTVHIKSECHLGERVDIQCEKKEKNMLIHRITDQETQRTIAIGESSWA